MGYVMPSRFKKYSAAANDLQKYTDMTMSTVTQRQSIYYNGSFNLLQYMVSQISGDIHTVESGAEKERPYQKVDLIVNLD